MIKSLFKLDLRSLAFARICLGILAFWDISRRIPDIDHFFTDQGMLPRWFLLENIQHNWKMSLLYLNGTYSFALILAILGLVATVTFTLGWRTRLSNAVIWLVINSFQARFPEAATSGGDMLFRIFLFYSLFLPMSARYSIDGAVSEVKQNENEYFSIFTSAWIVQVMLLYILTFLYKWAPVYHTTFDAVWYMLQLDIFTTDFGKWLGQQYFATKVLSFSAYALEILGPLLLFVPFRRDLFRGIAVISFWLFHIGIGLTMHLGNFVPICLIIWVGIIPTAWWNFLEVKVGASAKAVQNLYYDSSREFAFKLGMIFKTFFMLNVKLVPAEQAPAAERLIAEGHYFALGEAQNDITSGSSFFPKLLLTSRLGFLRMLGRFFLSDVGIYLNEVKEAGEVRVYPQESTRGKIAALPGSLYRKMEKILDSIGFDKVKFSLNKVERFFGGLLVTLVVSWNIEGYIEDRKWYIGSPFDEIMFTLNLNQGWGMFAPHPQRSDGWWVMEGVLKDGKKWDALNNKEVSFDRPESMYETYASEDWMKFLDNLQGSRDEQYLLLLGKHLCRKWNGTHDGNESLQTFKLHFMQEWTKGPQEPPAKVEKVTLWSHSCF